MMKYSACIIAVALAATTQQTNAFTTPNNNVVSSRPQQSCSSIYMSDTETETTTDSAFVADLDTGVEPDTDKTFDAVEKMGRGAAKIKRGKKKGGEQSAASTTKAAATLAPEETFYEGPPAITETLAPTLSIITVVGIVPAAAAWARQAWVRYSITNRRIRVTSGIAGKDMAEIVYPDVIELRTVKRLFGDGDVVFFLRDGAKFEMRNVPNFKESLDFILGNLDKDVVDMYKEQGDVGKDM